MKTVSQPKRTAGFSLFELIMVISILGIMTSIAIPLFATSEGCKQAKDERNAQSLTSLAMAAEAAGVDLVDENASVDQVVALLVEGVKVTKGPLAGRTFKLPGLNQDDINGAAQFLTIQQGELAYKASPDAVALQ